MKTREVESFLRHFANFLFSIPEFDTEGSFSILTNIKDEPYVYISFYDRDKFVAAVKAMGNATKAYTDGDYPSLEVTAKNFPLKLAISRDKVCTKVVTYNCEPLFSEEEVEAL